MERVPDPRDVRRHSHARPPRIGRNISEEPRIDIYIRRHGLGEVEVFFPDYPAQFQKDTHCYSTHKAFVSVLPMYKLFWSALAATATALPSAVSATSKNTTCQVVAAEMPGRVIFPSDDAYSASQGSYFAGQARDMKPGCIFMPTTTDEVSRFVRTVGARTGPDAKFAVRGGGHTLWKGAANIDNGITVDMRHMSGVVLSADGSVASLGPGGRFGDVYHSLKPHNLTVMGGRVPSIGVGGFLTSGGMTFLSRRHGFACDSVLGYEIVLASGEVLGNVTQASHPDLWLALKGGINNFGIVTRFDVATYPSDSMWYDVVRYNYSEGVLKAQAREFSRFMSPGASFDPDAMMGIFLDYAGGNFFVRDTLWHTGGVANPPVYKPFRDIPNLGGSGKLLAVADVVDTFGADIPASTSRAFQLDWSFVNPPAEVYMELFKIWEDGVKTLSDVEGFFVEFLTQPQSVVAKGTPSLFGLEPGRTDNAMMLMTAGYASAADDERVRVGILGIVRAQRGLLRRKGYLLDFIYANYADKSQGVYESWGADSVTKLQAASRKYDPQGVFQKRVPGGLKVF
ncbi:hypothetical protein GGTG_13035 [Gaeumannomyces tritici R3-111a-1]|uniref:FAD-binding PCMH-type domain-containing protein n=1 Tax=Gaeumannomyces tritici (strain R3-111a-1) TaxID=644352 RepID=J3PHQ4_GAET3|nr:hypothetical protein GGTG_13035 [Gaeumannomyces tritici R3-111a-1]EJT69416.1 hypothetical protein GGTG_13035 [Gaeumannomyces tritici R3-111a-1]